MTALVLVAALPLLVVLHAAGRPENELAEAIRTFFTIDVGSDWDSVEKIPGVRWAPLPPTELQNCLPGAGCFARQGLAAVGGRNLAAIAAGARTFVTSLFLRNGTAPFGEPAVIAALEEASISTELVRCPIEKGKGGTNWYRLKGGASPGYLAVQTFCNGKPCEGFVLTLGEDLPPLQPNQLSLYTEQCSATGAARKPVSTVLPHEQLARTLTALLPKANGPAFYSWTTLASLETGIVSNPGFPKPGDLSSKGDPNPWMLTANADYSGRRFSFLFGGTPTEVKTVYADEGGLHPRGEDLLGLLRSQGFTVQLVRCGPVYTESTNNWYRVTSPMTRPVMLKQSIRRDGNQLQDAYELRLDASLPARDPRDRDPGASGCQ